MFIDRVISFSKENHEVLQTFSQIPSFFFALFGSNAEGITVRRIFDLN